METLWPLKRCTDPGKTQRKRRNNLPATPEQYLAKSILLRHFNQSVIRRADQRELGTDCFAKRFYQGSGAIGK